MKDKFIILRQLISTVEHTKCPKCGKHKLEYIELYRHIPITQYNSQFIYKQQPSYLERKIKCNDCKNTFGFKAKIQDNTLVGLELIEK